MYIFNTITVQHTHTVNTHTLSTHTHTLHKHTHVTHTFPQMCPRFFLDFPELLHSPQMLCVQHKHIVQHKHTRHTHTRHTHIPTHVSAFLSSFHAFFRVCMCERDVCICIYMYIYVLYDTKFKSKVIRLALTFVESTHIY